MPIDFAIELTIRRPREDVFAVLTDVRRLPEWQPLVVEAEILDGGVGIQEGSRIREVRRAGPRRVEQVVGVAAFDPPRHFALRILEGPLPVHGDWRLEPLADGATRMSVRAHGEARGPLRLLGPLLPPLLRRGLRSQHERLRSVCEEGPESTGR